MTAIVHVTPPARLKQSFETVAARTSDQDLAGFLRMHASGGFGSGFLMVHKSGGSSSGSAGIAAFVVTNRHVIAESEEAEISFGDGTTYKNCEVVLSSAKHDLAVLALPESAVRALGPGLRPAPHDATDRLAVVASGYPGVSGRPSYQITDGKISNAKFTIPEATGDTALLQHTAPIDPGSSGGPLIDESGALVGVNVMLMRKRASMFFAVPASAVVETVREAHALTTKKREASWMSAELERACTTLSAELNSSSPQRLHSYISNALVAERGLESYALVSEALGSEVHQAFYQDPISTMRGSVIVRLNLRVKLAGGTKGTCGSVHPGDATAIGQGKPVRLGLQTKNGGALELLWTFEHGSWRIAGGQLVDGSMFEGIESSGSRTGGQEQQQEQQQQQQQEPPQRQQQPSKKQATTKPGPRASMKGAK